MAPKSMLQSHVETAYDAMAPFYDELTVDHDYELWLNALLPAARAAGLRGEAALDVACGTGKSFEPLLRRGWSVTACDISEQMLVRARQRAAERVRIERADMRRLPRLGQFHLVTCLGDALNHITRPEELQLCFRGFKQNLAEDGVLVFDVNTLHTFRTFFAESAARENDGLRLSWEGLTRPSFSTGGLAAGRFSASAEINGELLLDVVQRERHYSSDFIRARLESAGLVAHATYGHGFDAKLEQPLDESRHTKAIFLVRHRCK